MYFFDGSEIFSIYLKLCRKLWIILNYNLQLFNFIDLAIIKIEFLQRRVHYLIALKIMWFWSWLMWMSRHFDTRMSIIYHFLTHFFSSAFILYIVCCLHSPYFALNCQCLLFYQIFSVLWWNLNDLTIIVLIWIQQYIIVVVNFKYGTKWTSFQRFQNYINSFLFLRVHFSSQFRYIN